MSRRILSGRIMQAALFGMDTTQWVLIGACAVLVIAIFVLIGVLKRQRREEEPNVVMSEGVDIYTQKKGTDTGTLYRGIYDSDETVVLNGSGTSSCRITLVNVATGEHFPLHFRQSVGIGRAEDIREMEGFLTIRDDSRVSRLHCRLVAMNGQIFVEDAGSSNHTMVNDQVITRPYPLRDGDVIRIGNTRLRAQF